MTVTLTHASALSVRRARAPEWLACAALTWGLFAFGAVYPWAYWPLALACAAAGIIGLYRRGHLELPADCGPLVAAMALIAVTMVVQLLPLPAATLAVISPRAIALLKQLNVGFALGLVTAHSLSIDPASSVRALALYAGFGLMMLGLSRCSWRGALRLVWFISWLGMAVALTGIIQKALYAGELYGFWVPLTHGVPFGPFVNKNHFAGWTLMAIPLALGYLLATIDRARATVRPSVHHWVIWFSSQEANQAFQAGFAVILMGLALALTLSRSGMLSLALALILGGYVGVRRRYGALGRSATFAVLALATFLVVAWAGADAIGARFAAVDRADLSGRLPIWRAGFQIMKDFWPVGSGLNTYGITTLFYPTVVPGFHLDEAHNDYLQLAIEGGALLGLPIVLAVVAFWVSVRSRFIAAEGPMYWIRLGAVTGIVAIAIQSIAEFSLQMPANAALFATLGALALHHGDARRAPDTDSCRNGNGAPSG